MAETVEIVFDDKVIKGKDLTRFTQLMDQYLQTFSITAGTSSNPNLLINPDLSINQQGITEYTSIYNDYTPIVDGWKLHQDAGCVYNAETKTFTIPQSDTNVWHGIIQDVESTSDITGTVTVSANITTDVDIYLRLTYGNSMSDGAHVLVPAGHSGVVSVTCNIPDGYHLLTVQLTTFRSATSGGNVTVNWIKAEKGTTATKFTPPNPTEELIKCQKHFQISETPGTVVGTVIALSSTSGVALIPIPVSMNSIPSVALSSISLIGVGSLNDGDVTITGVDGDSIALGSGTVSFNITATDLVAGATYLMKIGDGGYLILSCR